MQKKISLSTFIFTLLLAILVSAMASAVVTRDAITDRYRREEIEENNMLLKLAELDERFNEVYIGETDRSELEKYVMRGYLAGTGDRYADYYTAEEYKEMISASNGSSQGIGINIIWDTELGVMEVIAVMPDSPALEAGVEVGDLIAYVGIGEEREEIAGLGYEAALIKLQGEAGTMAEFTVLRGDMMEEVEFSIERGYFSDKTVYSHLYTPDNSVGVIKISGFEGVTPNQFTTAVHELTSSGAESLIIDLRDNPGGSADSICAILDYLLPEGPLLRQLDADGNITVLDESDAAYDDIPLVVVVNSNTASAAELFAASMRDYDRAQIVGVTTYGKGSMQTYYNLSDGSVFKATNSLYCPPYSDNYDGVGITPDVEVELDESLANKNPYKITDEEDNQLAAAYELIK